MKKAAFLVVMFAVLCLIAYPAMAAKFVAVNQSQSQGAIQGQFSTGGLSVQGNAGVAGQAYRMNGGTGSGAVAGQSSSYGQAQVRLGGGFNVQGGVYGQNQSGSMLTLP